MQVAMSIVIEKYPSLPDGIIEAYNNKRLVVFVGAGISRLMGCNSWDDMANKLLEKVCKPAIANQIRESSLDSKAKITIAKRYAEKDAELLNEFWRTFYEAIRADESKADIYDIVSRLETPYITTNCDGLLAKHYPYAFTTDCTIELFNQQMGNAFVYCIHGNYGDGSDADKETLVFTVDEYLRRYMSGSPLVEFLQYVMRSNTVLFIGYGLREFEILNAAFNKVSEDGPRQHYMLEGFFEYQQEYCNALSEYYSSVGINLIAYSKDENGYKQQIEIIKDWVDELANRTPYSSRGVNLIKDSLFDISNENKERIYRSLNRDDKNGEIYLEALLNELPLHATCFVWLSFLIEKGLISSEKIPGIIKTESGERHPSSDVAKCISRCLKNQETSEKDLNMLRVFTLECIKGTIITTDVVCDNTTVLNEFAELCFQIDLIPKVDTWDFWKMWTQNTFDGGFHLLQQYIDKFNAWPDEVKSILFGMLLAPGVSGSDNRAYWFSKLPALVKPMQSDYKLSVAYDCVKNLREQEADRDFYHSIEDRYHLHAHGYAVSLFNILQDISKDFSTSDFNSLMKFMIESANTTFSWQLAFYFATLGAFYDLSVFRANPLMELNVFVDFYYWLYSAYSNKSVIDDLDIDKIATWINEGTFGLEIENVEAEWRTRIEERVNTYKYQLFSIMADKSVEYRNAAGKYSTKSLVGLKTPIEDRTQYYTMRDIEPEHYFPDVIPETASGEKLLKQLEDSVASSHWSSKQFVYYESMNELIEKVNDSQLEDILQYSFSHVGESLPSLMQKLHTEEVIKRCRKEFFNDILSHWIEMITIHDMPDELRQNVIRDYVYSLQVLSKCGWSKKEVFEIVANLDFVNLFSVPSMPNEGMDIVMNIINMSESQLYILLIESALQYQDDREIISKMENVIQRSLNSKASFWMARVCAFEIQNLFYLSPDWTKNKVIPEIKASGEKTLLGLCVTCNSNVIIKELVHDIFSDEVILDILEYLSLHPEERNNVDRFTNYIVAAYYFKYINAEQYKVFIENLNEDYSGHIVWSILFGIRDSDINACKALLSETIELYSKSHEDNDIASHAIGYMSRLDNLCADDWKMINSMVHVGIDIRSLWEDLDDCLEKTTSKCDWIGATFKSVLGTGSIPCDFTLRKVLFHLGKLELFETVSEISRFMVNIPLNPNEFSKYVENPQAVLADYLKENGN